MAILKQLKPAEAISVKSEGHRTYDLRSIRSAKVAFFALLRPCRKDIAQSQLMQVSKSGRLAVEAFRLAHRLLAVSSSSRPA